MLLSKDISSTSEVQALAPSQHPCWPIEVYGILLAPSQADSATHGSFPLDFFQALHGP